ncbi:MAG: TIGR00730 family Rossman fold protein [Myxococcota bacterium]
MPPRQLNRICVFTGSSMGAHPEYAEAAGALGRVFAKEHIELVYGGASVGLMGVLADEILVQSGRVHGVIPRGLASKEVMHASLTELTVVESMHARKQAMSDLADAFIAMPGGFGTFDELFEILTWAQLGIHAKPIGILNVAGYFDPLIRMIETAVTQGFVPETHQSLFVVETDAKGLVQALRTHPMPKVRRWITREQS